MATFPRKNRSKSFSSDDGSHAGNLLEDPILVYHESARSIVFRDHLRRAVRQNDADVASSTAENFKHDAAASAPLHRKGTSFAGDVLEISNLASEIHISRKGETSSNTTVANFQPKIVPLPALELGPADEYSELLESKYDDIAGELSDAERDVCLMLREQRCTLKTIKNVDWTDFLKRFREPHQSKGRTPDEHDDIAPESDEFPFNSFVTSTSLLPPDGKRMRCYGSTSQYTTGVVFGLPNGFADADAESEATARTQTWSWPAGYSVSMAGPFSEVDPCLDSKLRLRFGIPGCVSFPILCSSHTHMLLRCDRLQAKTEFNIDGRGRLINGRQEALRSLSLLRQYNDDYVNKDEYMIGDRIVSGLSQIPYNEVFLRVGGIGRQVNDHDCATGAHCSRSFERGCGIPAALFVRTATFGHLIFLLRTRSRLMHTFGEAYFKSIPLLFISPELGVRVLTETLQRNLWKIASSNLTPFQNSTISYKTTYEHTDEQSFQQKVDELIEFDGTIREALTPEELARLAGGFGASDDSVATILQQVMMEDKKLNRHCTHEDGQPSADGKSHMLQDVVNEGLAAAVRSGDYHTSRQLLMLYSLVASQTDVYDDDDVGDGDSEAESVPAANAGGGLSDIPAVVKRQSSMRMGWDAGLTKTDLELVQNAKDGKLSTRLAAPPPPPPLDTDRLRSATNSDGLLAVLGAAQVLKAMQDGGAKKRSQEAVSAVEEWINYGEQSMAFRISSWYDQRAAQGDLKIATEKDSKFMAFVSNKALSNRKSFAEQIRGAVGNTDFNDVRFLLAIVEILNKMNSPCLRLELLQYVLGLDNRYSVAHVLRSVELATGCLSISATATHS